MGVQPMKRKLETYGNWQGFQALMQVACESGIPACGGEFEPEAAGPNAAHSGHEGNEMNKRTCIESLVVADVCTTGGHTTAHSSSSTEASETDSKVTESKSDTRHAFE